MIEWYTRQLKKLEHSCTTKINNFRTDVMAEAREFIKKQLECTVNSLTKEHHRMIQHFHDFKAKTEDKYQWTVAQEEKVRAVQRCLCQAIPCIETRYSFCHQRQLQRFDCAIPDFQMLSLQVQHIKEIELEFDDDNYANSAEVKVIVQQAKDELEDMEEVAQKEIDELTKIKQLENEN